MIAQKHALSPSAMLGLDSVGFGASDLVFLIGSVIAARDSWMKDLKNRKVAVDFLRALHEGLLLSRENAAVTKKALRKFTRVDDDADLQGSFEFYKDAFPTTLRVVEKAMANAQRFVDHPKAKQADVKQFYDNSLVDEAMK
jgi:ABC-type nitrate/sulfonate/bicarbonate transport system substrate-binding protein